MNWTESSGYLVFSEDFPPDVGGIAQWAYGMAMGLHHAGRSLAVMTRFRKEYLKNDLPLTPFPVLWMHGRFWKQLRTMYCRRSFARYLARSNRPEVVLATTWNFSRGILSLAKKQGVRVVTVVHGLEVTRRMSWAKRRWMIRTLAGSDLVLAVSRFTAQAVFKLGIEASKVRVLPNGVFPEEFEPPEDLDAYRRRWEVEGKKVVLTLARVIPRKGHDAVIRALARISREVPGYVYLIAGPGDDAYLASLQRLAVEVGIQDKVRFLGRVSDPDRRALYHLCDVYVMPSRFLPDAGDSEGFGITFLEANVCGKPVIGARSGGVEDAILDGRTGFLVTPDHEEELAEKLLLLLRDAALATKLGQQGKKRVLEDLNWSNLAQKLIQLVENGGDGA